MNLLKREIAPITPEAWKEIDQEARRVLTVHLAARRIVDVDGPHGWGLAAVNTGVLDLFEAEPQEGVSAGLRKVQPLVELRAGFTLDRMELDSISRGSETPDLDPVARAAEKIALAEDDAVFNGYAAAGIQGVLEASPHPEAPFGKSPEEHMNAVVQARQSLEDAGVGGPYTLALGPRPYAGLLQALEDGDAVFRRVRDVVGGPIVQARALEGGVLVSTRGGDFSLTIGQDFSIGYVTADRDQVELYLASSFTFRAVSPDAAVRLP
jgi:uncharacterized linocin/CFP29 family protein